MNRTARAFRCFAQGGPEGWEAICVDLDVAVQGESLDEVKALLDRAVRNYIESAMVESSETRARLLNRSAPWWVTAGFTARLAAFNLFRGRGREEQASFPVGCPA